MQYLGKDTSKQEQRGIAYLKVSEYELAVSCCYEKAKHHTGTN